MMNAQKMIEERKKALTVLRSTAVPPPPPATVVPEANVTQLQDRIASQLDKQKKIQQLQVSILKTCMLFISFYFNTYNFSPVQKIKV